MTQWPIEDIPDEHFLYMRLLAAYVVAGEIQPGCFRAHGSGSSRSISTDWSKYSTPVDTRKRARSKPAADYGVLAVVVGPVRAIEGLTVEHAPIPENQAHTDVGGAIADEGVDHTEVRERLTAIASLAIRPEQPVE